MKQNKEGKEQIVQFVSGTWSPAEKNYSTIEKEVKAAWNRIDKFDIHLIHKKIILRTDASALKRVLSKAINKDGEAKFARRQALFSNFNFEVKHMRGKNNCLPNFLSREYLSQK